jgi:hypothetical protein
MIAIRGKKGLKVPLSPLLLLLNINHLQALLNLPLHLPR